ncbi:efflux RND transporter periplasmic adaptor subunit [Caballeronia sp. AZ10_KS36]|uniref:efflux RND transporter periplasmic adaptor subunit n=1 Tax=Caballeronia sp. AZ10_KS36 TaxID=2921757 RepID=UPI002027E858
MDTENKSLYEDVSTRTGRRWPRYVRVSVLLVVTAAVCAYLYRANHRPPAGAAGSAAHEVTVSRPLKQDVESRLGFLGQFSAVSQVELRAQVGGTLTAVLFKDGAIVRKGDPLFNIDPVPYEIRLAQAQANKRTADARLVLARQELARAEELQRNDAGTVESVEQRTSSFNAAQASVDAALAEIRDARFDLDHCRIVAPFTGRMGRHLVSEGNLVSGSRAGSSPTTLLGTLVSLDPIYLDFDMSESDYKQFRSYQGDLHGPVSNVVELYSDTDSETVRRGKLDFIDNVLDRSSGTIHARATVPNPDLYLTPGEFSRVRVAVTAPVPKLLVPDEAVLPDQSQHVVLTVDKAGMVSPKPVEVGEMHGGLRVITSGLSDDDRVIISGLPFAAPGTKVTTREGTIRAEAQRQ